MPAAALTASAPYHTARGINESSSNDRPSHITPRWHLNSRDAATTKLYRRDLSDHYGSRGTVRQRQLSSEIACTAWFFSHKKRQSARLQQRFGAEYGRTVGKLGGRAKAESELKARAGRVDHLTITALAPAEAARFSQAWNALQGRLVDNPKGVVIQADQLVRELMRTWWRTHEHATAGVQTLSVKGGAPTDTCSMLLPMVSRTNRSLSITRAARLPLARPCALDRRSEELQAEFQEGRRRYTYVSPCLIQAFIGA